MFEVSAALVNLTATGQIASNLPVLSGLSILSPMVLAQNRSNILQLRLMPITGTITINSLISPSAKGQNHMQCNSAAINASSMPASSQNEVSVPVEGSVQHSCYPCIKILLACQAGSMQEATSSTFACIESSQEQHGSGYFSHPAVADSCLQSGAIHVPTPTDEATFLQTTAPLPVGLKVMLIPSRMEGTSIYGTMGGAHELPNRTASSDYRLLSHRKNAGTFVEICDLQSKQSTRLSTAPSKSAASSGIVYALQWQASSVVASAESLSRLHEGPQSMIEWTAHPANGSRVAFRMPASACKGRTHPGNIVSAAQSAAAAASSLAAVQAFLASGVSSDMRVQLRTHGAIPEVLVPVHGFGNGSPETAGAAAVLKVRALIIARAMFPDSMHLVHCFACNKSNGKCDQGFLSMNAVHFQVAASEQHTLQWGGVFSSSSSVTKWQDISLDNGVNDSSGVAIESSTAMRPQMVRVQASGSFDLGARTDMKLHQGCAIVTGTNPFRLDSSFTHNSSKKYWQRGFSPVLSTVALPHHALYYIARPFKQTINIHLELRAF